MLLVGANTIGTEDASSGKDYVEVPRKAVEAGTATLGGSIAYWVGDEGVKISMIGYDDFSTASNTVPSASLMRLDPAYVSAAYTPDVDATLKVNAFEQLKLVKSNIPWSSNFHVATVTAFSVADGLPRGARLSRYKTWRNGTITALMVSGGFSANSTNAEVWEAACYLAAQNLGLGLPGETRRENFASEMLSGIKSEGPFLDLTSFANSTTLANAIGRLATPRPTPTDFVASLEPLLQPRSDTFRIRAYGDAIDPLDGTVLSKAYCEAIVQRTPEVIDSANGTLGRRFVITYFRWLGPDDI
ncbi:MAG: hypothetical protein NVV63_13015 [Opitutus sp.]|nr:hypothetical protein [Opitutus sp.]